LGGVGFKKIDHPTLLTLKRLEIMNITDIAQTLVILYLWYKQKQTANLLNEVAKEFLKTARKVFKK
tara:strand:+ start:146 stop:343 length:198 start_codon:yes stop_codon:yes gene_type:complete